MSTKAGFSLLLVCFALHIHAQQRIRIDDYKNTGFYNITSFSYSSSIESFSRTIDYDTDTGEGKPYVKRSSLKRGDEKGIQSMLGYFILPKLSIGTGLGLQFIENPSITTLINHYDIRFYLKNNYNSVYFFVDHGFVLEFVPSSSLRTGNETKLGGGYKFFVKPDKRLIIITDLGYKFREIKKTSPQLYVVTSHAVFLSLGLMF